MSNAWTPSRRHIVRLGAAVAAGYVAGVPTAAAADRFGRAAGWSGSSILPGPRRPAKPVRRHQFDALVRCPGRRIYVDGRGDDAASGSASAPLRQISTAIARAEPGDRIVVGSGTYGYTEVRGFTGRPDRWLGITTRDDSVRATLHVPSATDNFVNVIGSCYVGLYGFTVVGNQRDPNTNGSGISVYGNCHHVAIWNNHVHDFPGGGINCFDVDGSHDLLDIRYNVIHGVSKYSPSNTSGISIYASRDLTGGATFADGYGYRILGNYIYDVRCLVPYTRGGYDFVTDGNGISLDCVHSQYGYTKPILVADNIVTSCGGRGVYAYNTINVDMLGNTAVGNLRTHSPAITGGVELQGTTDRSVRIRRNVICPLHTPSSTDSRSGYRGNVILGGRQPVPAGNIDRRGTGLRYFVGPLTASALTEGPPRRAFTPA